MPTRYIKESICSSDDYNALTYFERDMFTRLIVTVDDYGRMDARASILRGRMFPLDEHVTNDLIERGLQHMSERCMVQLYIVDGRRYLLLAKWMKHQNPRAKESKYPEPPTVADEPIINTDTCIQTYTDANVSPQVSESVPVIDNRNRNSIIDNRNSSSSSSVIDARAREGDDNDDDIPNSPRTFDVQEAKRAAKAIGLANTPYDIGQLGALLAAYGPEWVITALNRAGKYGGKTWAYVDKVLKEFEKQGGIEPREGSRASSEAAGQVGVYTLRNGTTTNNYFLKLAEEAECEQSAGS
jgi:hypothetical protein